MTNTDNYGLIIVEGTDKVNPLTQLNPNFEKIDEEMKVNSVASIGTATELKTGTVHALSRLDGDIPFIKFTATANFTAGDTFTVDGVQVSALLVSGEQLPTGAYIIGSEVLCSLKGTLLTFYTSTATTASAKNAEKLGGQLPEYYGTAEAVASAQATATASGDLGATNSKAISELNTNLDNMKSVEILKQTTTETVVSYPSGFYVGNCYVVAFEILQNNRVYNGFQQGHNMFLRDTGIDIVPKDNSITYAFRVVLQKLN